MLVEKLAACWYKSAQVPKQRQWYRAYNFAFKVWPNVWFNYSLSV
jgi:hypothetical protein